MRELLISTVMGVLTSTSVSVAVANEQDFSKSTYFKLEGGIAQFSKIKEQLVDKHSKFKILHQIGLGFGGYIADRIRMDMK